MHTLAGFLLALLAGAMNGSFATPMKRTTKWAWENTWLVWAVSGLLVIPWIVAAFTVADPLTAVSQCNAGSLLLVILFGLLWGIGALTFGQSVSAIGIGLTFAIAIGLTTAIGSLVPMAANPGAFSSMRGLVVTGGVALTVIGVIVCAVAGMKKDAQTRSQVTAQRDGPAPEPPKRFVFGLVCCLVAGLFLPMLNFALNFSEQIKAAASAAGASDTGRTDLVWAITLIGAFAANLAYCAVLLTRNGTWSNYARRATGSHWFHGALMGALWMLSMTVYGRAAVLMGDLGGSAGWAIFMGCVIMTSNLWGILAGEWRGCTGAPIKTMYVGLITILVAVGIIGYGTSL